MKTTIIGAMLLALIACASSGENTKVGAGAGGATETNSAVLKPGAAQHLADLADVLIKYPDDRIEVVGFTDNTGSETYNQELSIRRAESVRRVLVQRGIPEKRAMAVGTW
jgi:outer membrane protein OmpA-like peptidoglycan-associated protein